MDIKSFFNSGTKPIVGLDISSSAIKLVELVSTGKKGGLTLERYAVEALPRESVVDGNIANAEAVSDAIRRAVRRMGSGVKHVAVALPSAAVITKRIILQGSLRELEMEAQVESEASQYIPFAIDEVNLDFQVLGPAVSGGDDVDVIVAASRKEKVEDRVAAAESAGLKVAVMDVESFATERSFELVLERFPGGGRNKIYALVDIGANVMNVVVLRNGVQLFSRELNVGGSQLTQEIARQYGMSFDEAESAKRGGVGLPDGYDQDLVKPFMDNVALEVSRGLQFFFTSTQYNQVDEIVLAGGCAVVPGLAEAVGRRSQLPTSVANPFAGMGLSSKIRPKALSMDAPSLMVACGLAMRRFD